MADGSRLSGRKVAVFLAEGFEDLSLFLPWYRLREEGIDVRLASPLMRPLTGQHGYRVVAHDRRGHGRSTQTADGHDMDHYADDLAALTAHLDLHDAIHVGH